MVRDLVVQAQHGDRDAFAALVGMTSDRMYALAARIPRDDVLAEDACRVPSSRSGASSRPCVT